MKIALKPLRCRTKCWVCKKSMPAGRLAAEVTHTKHVPIVLKLLAPCHPPCMVRVLRWLRKWSSQELTNGIRRLEARIEREKNETTKGTKDTK